MNLVQVNVWLDIIFVALYIFVLLFLIFHFTLFVTTGRFKKAFVEGHWPTHDERPPATPKALHAVHMFSMIILGFTGMYLRFPFFYGARVAMRNTHYVFMVIVSVVLIWRVWYAFFSKNKDWDAFAIRKKDIQSALGVLAYYGYFSNNKPHVAKYNVLQKMSYFLFLLMMFAQMITGFALVRYSVAFGISPSTVLLGWWSALVGGQALTLWYARTIHYILNWLFIIMTTVHLYLAATVDVPCALDFFGIREMQTVEGHGHDETPAKDTEPVVAPQLA